MGKQHGRNTQNTGSLGQRHKAMVSPGTDGHEKAWPVRLGLGPERILGLGESTSISNLILLHAQIPPWLAPVYTSCRALQPADLRIVI